MLLLVFYGFAPSVMVGTDIVHAIFLAGLTGALQYRIRQRRSGFSGVRHCRIDPWRPAGRLSHQVPSCAPFSADYFVRFSWRSAQECYGSPSHMLTDALETEYLARIQNALKTAHNAVKQFAPGTFAVKDNGGRDVITQVDRAVSDILRAELLRQNAKAGSPKRMSTTLAASRNKLSGWWIPSTVPASSSMTSPSGASQLGSLSTVPQSLAAFATLQPMRFFWVALSQASRTTDVPPSQVNEKILRVQSFSPVVRNTNAASGHNSTANSSRSVRPAL